MEGVGVTVIRRKITTDSSHEDSQSILLSVPFFCTTFRAAIELQTVYASYVCCQERH
jgi:hypothetical protein